MVPILGLGMHYFFYNKEEKFAKNLQIFLSKSSDQDPDPTWPKSFGSSRIRIHNTVFRN